MMKSLSFLLRMKNMSNENGRENENIFYVEFIYFFLKMVPFMRHRGKIMRSRTCHKRHNAGHLISCWIPEATSTHSEYVIVLAFPRHQWFHERALLLH